MPMSGSPRPISAYWTSSVAFYCPFKKEGIMNGERIIGEVWKVLSNVVEKWLTPNRRRRRDFLQGNSAAERPSITAWGVSAPGTRTNTVPKAPEGRPVQFSFHPISRSTKTSLQLQLTPREFRITVRGDRSPPKGASCAKFWDFYLGRRPP